MKITKKFTACLTMLVFMLMTATVAFAAEDGVDWTRGVIRATGLAAGKTGEKHSGLYRAQAKRAAVMDAQRNLAESVKGVSVMSDSSMLDLQLKYDDVRTKVETIIKGMREVEIKHLDDGTCQVILEMPLFGTGGDNLSDAAFLPFRNEPKDDFPQPVDKSIFNDSSVVNQNYTGLVIDCRGLNLNCVMSPVIKNKDGMKIYGHTNLDINKVIVNGMAVYAGDAYDQISAGRAGNNPFVVKAIALDDMNSTPVVSVVDADRILAANAKDKFLENCAVVFVK